MVYPLWQPAYTADLFAVQIPVVLLYQYYFPFVRYSYRQIYREATAVILRMLSE